MTDEPSEAQLFGQILTDRPLVELFHALRRAGLDAHYHESPHGWRTCA